MRHNFIYDSSYGTVSHEIIQKACSNFYHNYKVVPDTVKLCYQDYQMFIGQMYNQSISILEKGKQYGIFVMIPGGMVELTLLDAQDESVSTLSTSQTNQSVLVVESSQVDREFEKHVLKEN